MPGPPRGFNVADEAFFRDGLRARGSDFASFMSLDPYGAERFEVLRGPASVLYGQISPRGLLNYVSKRATTEPLGEIALEGEPGTWIAAGIGGRCACLRSGYRRQRLHATFSSNVLRNTFGMTAFGAV